MNIKPCLGLASSSVDLYPVQTSGLARAKVDGQASPLVAKVNGLFKQLKSSQATEPKSPLNFSSPQLGDHLLAVLNKKKPLLQALQRAFGQGGGNQQVKTNAALLVAQAVRIVVANRQQVTPQAIQSVLRKINRATTNPSFNAPSWSRYVDQAIAEIQKSSTAQVAQPSLPVSRATTDQPSFEFKSSEGHVIRLPATAAALFPRRGRQQRIQTLAKALEMKIDREIAALGNDHVLPGQDWGLYIDENQMALSMCAALCAEKELEPLVQVPEFVAQLVKAKLEDPKHYKVWYHPQHGAPVELAHRPGFKENGAEWRTKDLPQLFKELEQVVARKVAEDQKQAFFEPRKPKEPSADWIAKLKHTELGLRYPEIIQPMVRSVLSRQALAFLPAGDSGLGVASKFRGGYLKKGSPAGVAHTRVKAASGAVYALLNTLIPEAASALQHQHGLSRRGKVVLGEGGFGKVRLAMNIGTGQIVAVKKFLPNEQKPGERKMKRAPDLLANIELDQLDLIKSKLQGRGNTSLASYLDYAHVTLPHIQGNAGEAVGKSYIFMDLANAGDGKSAINRLTDLRVAGHQDQALSLFVSTAKNYTKALHDLHQLGLFHRDVKPANFLHAKSQNTQTEQARLADFGLLSQQKDDQTYSGQGTSKYLPPEAQLICRLLDKRDALGASPGASNTDKQAIVAQLVAARRHYSAAAHDAYSLGKTLNALWQGALGGGVSSAQPGVGSRRLRVLSAVITRLQAKEPKQRMSVAQAAQRLQNL